MDCPEGPHSLATSAMIPIQTTSTTGSTISTASYTFLTPLLHQHILLSFFALLQPNTRPNSLSISPKLPKVSLPTPTQPPNQKLPILPTDASKWHTTGLSLWSALIASPITSFPLLYAMQPTSSSAKASCGDATCKVLTSVYFIMNSGPKLWLQHTTIQATADSTQHMPSFRSDTGGLLSGTILPSMCAPVTSASSNRPDKSRYLRS